MARTLQPLYIWPRASCTDMAPQMAEGLRSLALCGWCSWHFQKKGESPEVEFVEALEEKALSPVAAPSLPLSFPDSLAGPEERPEFPHVTMCCISKQTHQHMLCTAGDRLCPPALQMWAHVGNIQ